MWARNLRRSYDQRQQLFETVPGLLAYGESLRAAKAAQEIINLDQYVVSNLMKLDNPVLQRNDSLKTNPFWQELRDLLMELRWLQQIVCSIRRPTSPSRAYPRSMPSSRRHTRTYRAASLSGRLSRSARTKLGNSPGRGQKDVNLSSTSRSGRAAQRPQ